MQEARSDENTITHFGEKKVDVFLARFEETTDAYADFESGLRTWKCAAGDGVSDLQVYEQNVYNAEANKLTNALVIRWINHGRAYMARFVVGDELAVGEAAVEYSDGTVTVVIPPLDECLPKRLGQ